MMYLFATALFGLVSVNAQSSSPAPSPSSSTTSSPSLSPSPSSTPIPLTVNDICGTWQSSKDCDNYHGCQGEFGSFTFTFTASGQFTQAYTLYSQGNCKDDGSLFKFSTSGNYSLTGLNSINTAWTGITYTSSLNWTIAELNSDKKDLNIWPTQECANSTYWMNENCPCGQVWGYNTVATISPTTCPAGSCPGFLTDGAVQYGNIQIAGNNKGTFFTQQAMDGIGQANFNNTFPELVRVSTLGCQQQPPAFWSTD